ncbi:MAG: DNA ligase D [Phycisphaerales bacterium]
MGLKDYQRKRNFDKTPEPAPKPARRTRAKASHPAGLIFVVQKHDATNLHYDLRLQVGDTLKSWAVPKGPSLDPRDKRLAIEVEDHPLEYGSFEGTIPAGEYGGGTVMLWDTGTWTPEGDAATSLRDGMLKFSLAGQRLKGRWMLVRTKRAARQPQWLLVKERDAHASPGVHAEAYPTSVTSHRSMAEIARNAKPREPKPERSDARTAASLTNARAASMPARIKPQLAALAAAPPPGDEWTHEVKFDGYRLMVYRSGDAVRILSRSGLDWTNKLPEIARAVQESVNLDAVIDGEAVVLNTQGISDFQALQNSIHNRRATSIVFIAFDLPWCDGFDLRKSPLDQRRALLADILASRQEGRVRLSQHVEGNGQAAFESACRAGLEGIVSKRRSAPYSEARSPSWIKVKCFNQQEFVVGGFTAPEGSRAHLGALLLGYHDRAGTLCFAGKVGTGFSTETLRELHSRLRTLLAPAAPFVNPPMGIDARGVTWVKPELVVQAQFRDWSSDRLIRHASFRGIRDDLDPGAVVGEQDTRPPAKAPPPARTPPSKKSRSARVLPAEPISGPALSTRLTHPDRVVFPDRGGGFSLTKRDLAAYYTLVAPFMLPHVAQRPLSILRAPQGQGAKSFFQKHPAKGMPAAVHGVDIADDSGDVEQHLLVHDLDGLFGLVQMNAIEIHPWGSLASSIQTPDRIIFDLDPGEGVTWRDTVQAAALVRRALEQVTLVGFVKTSGGKGLHVVAPIRPEHPWDRVTHFCRVFAQTLAKVAPRQFVAVAGAQNRKGRLFIDYLRNVRGATTVGAYSTRARPGAPVSVPITWDELDDIESPAVFNVPTVMRRLRAVPSDPWADLNAAARPLPI